MRVLVVTAVPAEREAVTRGCRRAEPPADSAADPPSDSRSGPPSGPPDVAVVAAGVGPAAAAAGTARALALAERDGRPFGLVVSAGIGGGFAPHVDGPLVATAIIAADLGAQTHDGFASLTELGFGTDRHPVPLALAGAVAKAAGAVLGPVLTVSTATGTAERAAELAARHPGAVGEAMEGFGVAEAATALRLPALEIRTVSNSVGPRDRAAWRVHDALEELSDAFTRIMPVLADWREGEST
ncbi:futalosine hydrolase [Streptomyces alkaliterrae]|uniref:Futalosine hydrolase n=1 Tax=Streptomyces alkaliterrae TaxID=2213162 RepID=A0A5P0YU04_9ACTN|nr:futalosine hydrolase [Streptomyces alkaliterrae]MBB1261582.1 futalosine hydrolase [Streptomyces alkaliterrae]MQS03107.1 futalosine hydrolase [Streptomyces alkaliterrae]